MRDVDSVAPDGTVYVCSACGKTSPTRSGWTAGGRARAAKSSWDESCMLHATLCVAGGPPWTAVDGVPVDDVRRLRGERQGSEAFVERWAHRIAAEARAAAILGTMPSFEIDAAIVGALLADLPLAVDWRARCLAAETERDEWHDIATKTLATYNETVAEHDILRTKLAAMHRRAQAAETERDRLRVIESDWYRGQVVQRLASLARELQDTRNLVRPHQRYAFERRRETRNGIQAWRRASCLAWCLMTAGMLAERDRLRRELDEAQESAELGWKVVAEVGDVSRLAHDERDAARASLAAASRELERHRHRHGETLEGDGMCPDSLQLSDLRRLVGELMDGLDEQGKWFAFGLRRDIGKLIGESSTCPHCGATDGNHLRRSCTEDVPR